MTPRTGQLELRLGHDRVHDRVETSPWWEAANAVLLRFVAEGRSFTTDEIRSVVGDPPAANAMGMLVAYARKRGLIRSAGRATSVRASARGRTIELWGPAT